MLKNYIKIAFRNFYRNRGNSFINVFGLGTALLCCIVIFLYVRKELTYDHFHTDSERIYRLTVQEINRPGARHFASTSPPMGPALVRSFPEIEQAVRFRFTDSNILRHADRRFYEYRVAYADSGLLTMFDFPLALGDPETALRDVNSIILTAPMARKYFGNVNPLGKSIVLDNRKTLTVTGVFEPLPSNTHLKFDCIISFDTFEVPMGYPVTLDSWGWVSFYTYVKLSGQADKAELEAKFKEFLITNMGEEAGGNRILRLQRLEEVYHTSPDMSNAGVDLLIGNIGYVYGMTAVAIFLLLIACFNYMNLSTAQAIRRSKEVGVRKTLGAGRSSLIRQFILESILLTVVSVTLALLFLQPFLELVSSYLGITLSLQPGDYKVVILLFFGLTLLVGVAAGFYPSFVISRYHPSKALKGITETHSSKFDLRKILVVLQFSIAILLIAGSMIIRDQIQFMQQKDLGFNEEQVMVLHMDARELTGRYRTIKDHLLQNRNVIEASLGGGLLDGRNGSVPIYPLGSEDPEGYPMNIYGVHFDYFETLDINMVEGRSFDESFATDSADGIIVNRAAVQAFGWEDPLGKELQVGEIMDGRVIGVSENFHFASLHREIQPLVMYIPPTNMEKLFVRIKPGNMSEILRSLEQSWNQVVPDFPFSFIFMDEHLNQLYQNDKRFFRLVTAFTFLTILIACLGLYGLINFFIEQRTKEIGIRKILGASIAHITILVSKRFLLLVAVANIIAWPLAWFAMDKWLQNFAYQMEIGIGVFLLAGLAALAVAWITLSYRTIRAATVNPVDSLRSE